TRKSDAGAKGKVELHPLVVELVRGDGDTEVEAQRSAADHETDTDAEVVVVAGGGEVPRVGVHETDVIEDGETQGIHDLEGVLDAAHGVGVATDRVVVGSGLGTDVAVFEAAQGAGAAEEEAVEVGDAITVAVFLDHAGATDEGD